MSREDLNQTPGARLDDEPVADERAERIRLSAQREAARRERRRRDQQFVGLVMICAVVCFAIGLLIAKVVWKPEPSAAATGTPGSPATAPKTPAEPAAPKATERTGSSAPRASLDESGYDIAQRDPIPIGDRQQFIEHMKSWRHEDPKFLDQRWDRYQKCVELTDLKKERVKEAFLATPREFFCRKYNLGEAYAHAYLGIGYGVTISGPHIVCRMTDRLDPQPSDRCLEIGTGSGYQAAMLANLSNHVYSIEIIAPLLKETEAIFAGLVKKGYDEYRNVHLKAADGYYGWAEHAPFDKIIVTCAIDHVPPDLLKQLAPGGVMVIPIGPPNAQRVLKITNTAGPDGKPKLVREDLYPGREKPIQFVPFTTASGGTHFKQ
jgi:protein-L-isoaspartate(D-aspartate) O-methyltransferase